MSKVPMKTVNATYNKKTGVLKVEARSEEVLPEYMKYYLIYLGLPEDTKVVYTLDKKKPKN